MAAPDCLAAQCFCRKSEAINSERGEHLADIIQRARSMIDNCIASRTIEIRVDRHNARQRMDRTSPIFPFRGWRRCPHSQATEAEEDANEDRRARCDRNVK